ncbi:unnamed protein product [Meloidogyne enterolobii]|uniref:Uncharacterized protein n=1 Tax=Meloidogyne enterolobii TaxID=390850 RepID=A0ACB1A3C1_MELEN
MEELKNFKPIDLYEKLRLSDNDFDAWLEKLGLLHGKRTCYKCGGRTTISVKKDERYGCWRCTTKNCRARQGMFSCLEFGKVNNPVIQNIYDLYSFQLIPVIGQLLVGDFNSYKYLVESIRVFPDQQKFSKMVKEAGFNNVTFEELNFGICNIYCGSK